MLLKGNRPQWMELGDEVEILLQAVREAKNSLLDERYPTLEELNRFGLRYGSLDLVVLVMADRSLRLAFSV